MPSGDCVRRRGAGGRRSSRRERRVRRQRGGPDPGACAPECARRRRPASTRWIPAWLMTNTSLAVWRGGKTGNEGTRDHGNRNHELRDSGLGRGEGKFWLRILHAQSFPTSDSPRRVTGLSHGFRRNLQGGVRLLVHARQESGVAGVVADGIEQRVHADESHRNAVLVERVLE